MNYALEIIERDLLPELEARYSGYLPSVPEEPEYCDPAAPATEPAALAGEEPPPNPAKPGSSLSLGSNDEVMFRFRDFALFWRKNPELARFDLQAQARDLLPNERVKKCLRLRVTAEKDILLVKRPDYESAFYHNLQRCGSVWHCPICSTKIATYRRDELTTGVNNWTEQGNRILLATFTMQHLITDPCSDVLNAITKAQAKFWQGRKGKALWDKYKFAGKVRGLEVTYTPNGWHWHFHLLFFIEGELSPIVIDEMREEMSQHWSHVVSRAGKFADSQHGLTIKATDRDVADYVSKYGKEGEGTWRKEVESWTEAHELALAPIKRASKGGLTPFQLLAMSLAGDPAAGPVFVEFAKAVKGKCQLKWSKGLRARAGLTGRELTDEEIAAKHDARDIIGWALAELEQKHWRVIDRNAARGQLKQLAATGDHQAVLQFLADLGLHDVKSPGLSKVIIYPDGFDFTEAEAPPSPTEGQ